MHPDPVAFPSGITALADYGNFISFYFCLVCLLTLLQSIPWVLSLDSILMQGKKFLYIYIYSIIYHFLRRNETCAGRPGSLGYEKNDANSYASWGVDYLKYLSLI